MKLIMVASATGGAAKTTTAVRLGQALNACRVPTGILDLSPYPTAAELARTGLRNRPDWAGPMPVLLGRGATTAIAAGSILKPYEGKLKALVVDTGRLDDPILRPWASLLSALILTTRGDRFSLSALDGVGPWLADLRTLNPQLQFLGFLPVALAPGEGDALLDLKRAAGRYLLPFTVPEEEAEWARSHASLIEGLEAGGPAGVPPDSMEAAHAGLAQHVAAALGLEPLPAPAPDAPPAKPKEVGLISRLWKLAGRATGPKVVVEPART